MSDLARAARRIRRGLDRLVPRSVEPEQRNLVDDARAALAAAGSASLRRMSTAVVETGDEACLTLAADMAWAAFESLGLAAGRVMADNGSACKSHPFRNALAAKAITHKRTRPYTPRTNGKAERLIQTSLHERLYASPCASSRERTAMPARLCGYNSRRSPRPFAEDRPSEE